MSMEEDLVRLVRATVKAEVENHMRNRSSELIGRGGDTVVGGMGNIYLQPGPNKKAFYKGAEIGTGSTGGMITGSGTTNYIPRFTSATVIGNSHLVDNGSTITSSEDIEMLTCATAYYANIKTAEIESKRVAIETVDYYGLQITPHNTHETSPGNFFIGDYNAMPAGTGLSITGSGIFIIPVGAYDVNMYNSIMFQSTYGGQLGRARLQNASTAPSVDKGGIYYDTDDNNVYVNKGTYAAPSWQLIGGAAVWGSITGTLSNQTDLQTALDGKLSLTGGTLTNDLTIKDASPMLYFTNDSDAPLGSIGSLGGGFYIGNDVDSGSIYIRTGASPTTRMQIYDTGVALGVPLYIKDGNTYLDNSSGDLVLHVASGKVVKIIVG